MDYLNGVPMGYPKWTTLKFVANMNLTMLEPGQQSQLRITCDVTDVISNWTFVTKHWRRKQTDREAEL